MADNADDEKLPCGDLFPYGTLFQIEWLGTVWMRLSQKELDEIQFVIRRSLASTTLNSWERRFLQDMQKKFGKFGRNTRLTPKQSAQLTRLTSRDGANNWIEVPQKMPGKPVRERKQKIGNVLVIAAALCFMVYKAIERFPEYLGPMVEYTALDSVTGQVTRVRDGDTIEVSRVPVRFGSLDCAEQDTREGQRATAHMRSLISGQVLTCHFNGRTSYDRNIGSCRLNDGRDLASIMIQEGYCQRYW